MAIQSKRPGRGDRDVAMIAQADAGVIINVRVIPRAGRSEVAGIRDNALLVRLNAPPVDGAANAELIQVIAKALGVPKRAVSIVSGDTSRQKRVKVEDISPDRAASRLPH
jgi:uncharacterized protein (TIGR00251 family)